MIDSAPLRPVLRAHAIGSMALDRASLARELPAMEALAVDPCVGYAHGAWGKCMVLRRAESGAAATPTAAGAQLPYLLERIAATFRLEHIFVAQLFAARSGAFVRPHVDWKPDTPIFTRLHVPLQTSDAALNSEDDAVFRMGFGEVWYLDASRPHSGGCFSDAIRIHLIVDLDPSVDVSRAFVDASTYQPRAATSSIERRTFTARDEAAILALSDIVTDANFGYVLDVLAAVHFGKAVDCATTYDWLDEIARRSGNPQLVARAADCRRLYLTPFG